MASDGNDPRWDAGHQPGQGYDPEADWPTNPGFPRPDLGPQRPGPVGWTSQPGSAQVPSASPASGSTARPPAPSAPKRPGVALIALVTIVLGPLGAVPAAAAASTARKRGLAVLRYWVTFLIVWAVHLAALLLIVFSWLGGGFGPGSGGVGVVTRTSDAPTSAAQTSAAPASPTSPVSPAPSTPTTSVAASFPASATNCGGNVAANSMTSCQFAAQVSAAYRAAGSPAAATLVVTSPVTGRSYSMACTAASAGLVTCSGGNNAVVYLR